MGLRAYLVKRTIYSFALLFFVLLLNFAIFELMPGDPTALFANAARLGGFDVAEQIIDLWGFDQPIHIRLFTYIKNMLTFQFGTSYITLTPVAEQVADRLLNTFLLVGLSSIFAIILGVSLGVLAAYKRGTIWDSIAVVTSLTTYSLPSFWMGMIFLLVFAFGLGWFPDGHTTSFSPINPAPNIFIYVLDRMWHLFLPCLVLTLFMYGSYLLLTRATMMEALTEDYITTARAKGLRQRAILFKHALKNASLPIITNAAISIGFIISGAIITEQVFNYPGLGQWTWRAIPYKDFPVLHCIFYLTALCVIIANFIADVLYGILDPRIKYG